ncbi:MAG TPA: tetratricopeptide repeat protein [Phototrophicaceae bacterium]|nr:tetratricopeptide repeat protein [Phototrophicaceae bacterium]
MKKTAVIVLFALFVILSVMPVLAQQSSQSAPPLSIATDLLQQGGDDLNNQQYDKAVLDLSLFIMLNPTYSPGYYTRAQSYIGLNDYAHALEDVDQAIDTAGSIATADYSAELYSLRGQIDQQQKNVDDALKDFTQSITIKPNEQALANRGVLYLSKQDFQSALDDFNDAIQLDPSSPALYVYRGLIHTQMNDPKSSGADYLQFFSLIKSGSVQTGQIQSGQSVSLNVDQGVIYQLQFTANAGQYISALAVARTGNVDPLMVLIDNQGNPLYGDDDSGSNGGSLILNYPVTANGSYSLLVSHSLGGYQGSVLVQLQVSDTPQQ